MPKATLLFKVFRSRVALSILCGADVRESSHIRQEYSKVADR